MKRYYFILLLLICQCLAYSQIISPTEDKPWEPKLPNVIYPSPHAMAFMRYGNIPVSLSTGIPNIDVPIYTLNANNLEIPINISYHASGLKVKDIPGTVGRGWILNAGGMIAQTVYTWADKTGTNTTYKDQNIDNLEFKKASQAESLLAADYQKYYSSKYLNLKWSDYLEGYRTSFDPVSLREAAYNTVSDRYSFNFNGRSGVFRYNLSTREYETIPYSPLKIKVHTMDNANGIITKFSITDENGHIWVFTKLTETSLPLMMYQPITAKEYYLTSVQFPGENNTAYFEYNLGEEYIRDTPSESVFTGTRVRYEYVGGGDLIGESVATLKSIYSAHANERSVTTTTNGQQRKHQQALIKTIKWKDVAISFNYHTSGILKESLKEIIVKVKDTQVRKATLNFTSDNLLSDISVNDEKHSFKYFPGSIPDYKSFSEDFWGYYNANISSYLVPFKWEATQYGFQDEGQSLLNWRREYLPIREPSLEKTKIGTLYEITYPTKGKTVFEYELNRGKNVYQGMKPCENEIENFGGLRIRKVVNYDNNGTITDWKEYEYFGGPTVTITPHHFIRNQEIIYWSPQIMSVGTPPGGSSSVQNPFVIERAEVGSVSTDYPFVELGGQTAFYHKVIEYSGFTTKGWVKTEYSYDLDKSEPEALDPRIYNYKDKGVITPILISQKEYTFKNGDYILKKEINNEYENINKGDFVTGIEVKHRYEFSPKLGNYFIRNAKYIYNQYYNGFIFRDIKAIKDINLLTKSETTTYSDNGNISSSTVYNYDSQHRLLSPIETIVSTSDGNVIKEQVTHPFNYPLVSPYSTMELKNVIAPVVTRKKYKNNTLLATLQNTYRAEGTSLYIVDNVSSSTGNNTLKQRIKYHKYDKYGNVVHVSKDSLMDIIYIWGYQGKYPLAEIKNASYNNVKTALGNIAPESLSDKNESQLPDLDALRNHSLLKDAHISTYKYNAYGLVLVTDPSGLKTNYDYDSFGRLKNIKDNESKLVNQYEYNYANSSSNNPEPREAIMQITINSNNDFPEITPGWGINKRVYTAVPDKSGDFRYNWYLKDSDGNILQTKLNTTSNTFEYTPVVPINLKLSCGVVDLNSGMEAEGRRDLQFINMKNSISFSKMLEVTPSSGTRKQLSGTISNKREITIKFSAKVSSNDRYFTGRYTIGNHTFQLAAEPNHDYEEVTLSFPAGNINVDLFILSLSDQAGTVSLKIEEVYGCDNEIGTANSTQLSQSNSWGGGDPGGGIIIVP